MPAPRPELDGTLRPEWFTRRLCSLPLSIDPESSPYQLRHFILVLRRRRLLIILVTVALTTVTIAASLLQTPMYRSSAEIVFPPPVADALTGSNRVSVDPARDIQTQIEVMTSRPVADLVAKNLHIANPPHISAASLLGTNAMVISATSTTSSGSSQIANVYASAYIEYRRTQVINTLLDAAQLIQTRITSLQTQIDALNAQIDSASAAQRPSLVATVGPQRDALLAQQSLLKQKLDDTQFTSALGAAGPQLAKPGMPPSAPFSPKLLQNTILAILLGMIVGAGIAFTREYLDDSVTSKEDVERAAEGISVIARIPTVEKWKAFGDALIVSLDAPTSGAAEAYRSLRTSVQFLALDRSHRLILVTSPNAGEGKTTTLANLAVALGRVGQRVCMVSCDLRRPRLHHFFDLPDNLGLTSVVFGQAPLSDVIQKVPGLDTVSFLGSGPTTDNPAELISSLRMKGILTSLAALYDIVLIDSPPILPVTDASILASCVDGVVVVVKAHSTKKRSLSQACGQLRQVDAPIVGLILNGSTEEASYTYEYTYQYSDETERKAMIRDKRYPQLSTRDSYRQHL